MRKRDIWAVAAALLLREGKELHYREITERILDSGRTTLGEKGYEPHQTVGSILREHKEEDEKVFKATGGGYYYLRDTEWAANLYDVRIALMELNESKV